MPGQVAAAASGSLSNYHKPRPCQSRQLGPKKQFLLTVQYELGGSTKPAAPVWLRKLLGDDFFNSVVNVRLPRWSGGGIVAVGGRVSPANHISP